MNLLLLGGTITLLDLLEEIIDDSYIEKISVVTSPRHAEEITPSGVTFIDSARNILKKGGKKKNGEVYNLDSIENEDFVNLCNQYDTKISISAAWIYKKEQLEKIDAIYQLHNTDLPRMRGGASYSWMIMSGMRDAATTLFKVDTGIDTGKIVLSKKYKFPDDCKKPIDYDNYALKKTIEDLSEFIRYELRNKIKLIEHPQDEKSSTYFPRLKSKVNGCINWSWSCNEIIAFINAFDDPYSGAFTRTSRTNNRIYIKSVDNSNDGNIFHPFQSGLIYRIEEEYMNVCAGNKGIKIRKVLDENGNIINQYMKLGDRLYSNTKDIEDSISNRIYFKPKS